jgi:hypothetical protein
MTRGHVLELFTVANQSLPYQEQESDDALRDYILAKLDEIFDGAATHSYKQHIAQN